MNHHEIFIFSVISTVIARILRLSNGQPAPISRLSNPCFGCLGQAWLFTYIIISLPFISWMTLKSLFLGFISYCLFRVGCPQAYMYKTDLLQHNLYHFYQYHTDTCIRKILYGAMSSNYDINQKILTRTGYFHNSI